MWGLGLQGPSLLPSRMVLVQNVILILGWSISNPSQADVGPLDRAPWSPEECLRAGRVLITEACSLSGRGPAAIWCSHS